MAAGLLQQMTRIPDSPQVYGDGAADVLLRIAEFLRAHETASDEPAGEWEAELEEHRQLAGRLSDGLAATLANDGVSLERVALPLRVIEEARDYYWCQYRDSASSG